MTGANLNFDTGTVALNVQGDPSRKFCFNPTDPKTLAGFLHLVDEATIKAKSFGKRAVAIDEDALPEQEYVEKTAELLQDIDKWFRGEFDILFGAGQAELVFGNISTSAINSDGEYVMIAMLMALYPHFEAEIDRRSTRIDKAYAEVMKDVMPGSKAGESGPVKKQSNRQKK